MTIERHLARDARRADGERLAKERLCGRDSAVASEKKVDRLSVLVDGTIQVVPLRLDLDERLIKPP